MKKPTKSSRPSLSFCHRPQSERAPCAEDAQDLPAVGIGRGDQTALAHLFDRVLPTDHDLHPPLLGHAGQEVDEPRLVLEGLEKAPHGADVAEIRLIQHVDGAADVEIAVTEEAADLLEEAAMARPQRVEWIRRVLHVVEDGLEGLAPIASGEGAADAIGSSFDTNVVAVYVAPTLDVKARSPSDALL